MWFYPILAFLVIVAIVGGIFAGGIFTIVLVPLALIAVGSWIFYGAMGPSGEVRANREATASLTTEPSLPHIKEHDSGHEPTTPERLVDLRRQAQ